MRFFGVILTCLLLSAPALADAEWDSFRRAFLMPEGRVVDDLNNNVSHSEGQGFGMLLAVAHDDRRSFDLMWRWTRETLQRPDGLLAWRYVPDAPIRADAVPDLNNASDGDVLVAWALLRASERWDVPQYRDQARELALVIADKLIRDDMLLPAADFFWSDERRIVNLSYWVFPALRPLEALTGRAEWGRLWDSGAALAASAHFGRWDLPPNWLDITATPKPAEKFPPHYGYEAIRIPLYLVWGGVTDPKLLRPYVEFRRFFDDAPFLPAWTDLTDDSVDSLGASQGIRAIYDLAEARMAGRDLDEQSLPALDVTEGYYSSALLLLAKLAARDQ